MNNKNNELETGGGSTEIEWTPIRISKERRDSDIRRILSSMPLFQNLSRRDWRELSDLFHQRKYSNEEVIFEHDTPGLGMYIIIDGMAKVYSVDRRNKKTEIANLLPGDFFGEMSLIEEVPRSATVASVGTTNLIGIFRPQLRDLMHRRPRLGLVLMERLALILVNRLREANKKLIECREQLSKLEKK